MYDLSILIPARNEQFLALTVESILKNIRGKTEILVGLDGEWANPPIKSDPRLTIIHVNESIGQRAMTNQLCRLSTAKYVMKIDAHCIVDEGFDVKMMGEMKDNYTMIPTMYNLHAFDWVCKKCGNRSYQGPTLIKCLKEGCDGKPEREMIWKPRFNRKSETYLFDKDLHFQYWGELKDKQQGDIIETMSAQGSCFMLTRDKYWELDICDEKHGSWGQQGTEVACKTWLSGGRLVTNRKTWYSHMFRTQGGDFGFPYPLSGNQVDHARKYSKELWIGNSWPKAIHNLDWLIEKFKPIPYWHDNLNSDLNVKAKTLRPIKRANKGVVYYTDNKLNEVLLQVCQKQLLEGIKEKHIVSATLRPIEFGKNIVIDAERGYLTMAKQILKGLEASDADVIFFAEHDVLYHPSHFDFIPSDKNKIYYNTNVWRVRLDDGHALYTDNLQQLSGLVAYRDVLIKHYKKRVELLSKNSDNNYVRSMGFEPGTHNRAERVDDLKADSYSSKYPNLDIRHGANLTPSRWNKDQFKNQKFTEGWKESNVKDIPGWDKIPLDF